MIKKLMSYIGEFKRDTILSPIFVTLEVFLEVLLPTLMALVIDNGVETGDMNYVMKMGLIMLVVAMLSLAAGTLSGVFAAKASMGFGRNLRRGASIFSRSATCPFSCSSRKRLMALVWVLAVR